MNIAIADPFSSTFKTKLEPYGIIQEEVSKSSEVVLVRSRTKIDRTYMENLPDLKLIIRGGIGLDNIDTENARGRGITVKNTPLASAVSVAELAFALLISIPSKLIDGHSSMMKEGAAIINTARGKYINSKDLCDALESGKISAYAADVWEKEPPDESCILKNVIMTPHIGSSSKENSDYRRI